MSKLLAIITLGQKAYDRILFQRLLSGMIVIAALTIVLAVMVSLLLAGCLIFIYFAMQQQGIEASTAMFTVGMLALGIIIALAIVITRSLQRVQEAPANKIKDARPFARAANAVDAFADGLMRR